jgi:hypothetical protein
MSQANDDAPQRFPSTHWSLVVEAAQRDAACQREALGRLVVRYLPALRTHLIFGKRLRPDRADDLLQEFIAEKILEKDMLAQADRQLGRFRTLLLTALDRFVLNRIRAEKTKKRAPSVGAYTTGDDWAELLPCPCGAADTFDVAWARGVILQAIDQMRAECVQSGRMDVWGVFECRVLDPILRDAKPLDYRQLTERFGFRSPGEASNVLVTGKRMYVRALRGVIGQYAGDGGEIEAEIADLHTILAGSRG